MLKAVTFDYWNTLFVDVHGRDRERRRAEILRAELAALGRALPQTALDESLRDGFDFFDRVWIKEHRTPSCGELVDSILAVLGAQVPETARGRLVSPFELLVLDMPPEPMPSAVYTLPLLAERYRLAVVCDTGYSPGSVLRELLERNGMLAYFEYLYFSNEHGMSKPDVRVIQRTDIAGAQAAGMAAVHFIGANNHDAGRSTADLIVRHFDELPAALGGLTCAGC